jgi:16S rRNA processing protein RimM
MTTSVGVITRVDGTAKKPVVAVDGVASRGAAEALRGTPILVDRAAVPLEEGEWWADDLVGLRVVDGERAVGVVDRVRALPSCEVLEVGVTSSEDPNLRGSKDETLLIPLVDDAVRTVDLEAGVIDVDLEFLGAG